ncbi:Single-stranded DNA-binding protein why1, chloroplastic [Orobanche gracilis]
MVNTISLCAAPAGVGGFSIRNPHKLSSFDSAIPASTLFSRTRNASLITTPHGNHTGRSLSFSVQSQYMKSQEQQQKFPSHDTPSSSQPGQLPPRVFVGYSVYKGKAVLTVVPGPPEFSPLDSGAFRLSKEGSVLLQFAPAVGVCQYDWGRKQVFSLSVGEIGNIISLGARDSCEFFHDPNKGKSKFTAVQCTGDLLQSSLQLGAEVTAVDYYRELSQSDEGRVRKVLKVEPLPDGSGHFFNLSVQNKHLNVGDSIYIPITKAEFAVLVSLFNFILPYLLGWHTFANTIKLEDANCANPIRSRADFEWNR